jgi:HTH-type transcriptional regulator, competence development regulator
MKKTSHASFGEFIRYSRERLREEQAEYSLRKTAQRVGLEPSYLSKIERGDQAPPSEEKIRALAADLRLDADVLLAMAGKVSTDLRQVIMRRPQLFAELLRELKDLPDDAVVRLARQVRDGNW